MKKYYSFLLFVVAFCTFASISRAQMVGDNVFLGGSWVQICVAPNGSLGSTVNVPAGYATVLTVFYADPITCVSPSTSYGLAENFDVGRGAWPAGLPSFPAPGATWYGDYTLPGSPWEGWCIEIGGIQDNAWYTNLGCGSYFSSTGISAMTVPTYGYSRGRGLCETPNEAKSFLYNSDRGVNIRTETRVDTNASWVVMTVILTNTSGSPLNNIYYMRTCDPDNDEDMGGSFATYNTIQYQDGILGTGNRVMVTAQGMTYNKAYLGLCTKDCRAHSYIAESWPDFSGYTSDQYFASVAAGAGNTYALGGTDDGDYAIGIVYQIPSLAAGDSTFISYAYTFDAGAGGGVPVHIAPALKYSIDSAFPDPYMLVNCARVDTINMCTYVGTTATVNIFNGDDKMWTWGNWTWSPAIGLATTTGVNNTINLASLTSAITTYTITGQTSPKGSPCPTTATFYVTVLLCNGLVCNSPCYGDTLKLSAIGTATTGVTYSWSGPGALVTTTSQSPYVYPTTFADSGLYSCIVYNFGIPVDTFHIHAYIRPVPTVTATNNSPLCAPATLDLFATLSFPGETYSWSGPGGFTSILQNPTEPFVTPDTGRYTVIADYNGCYDTATTIVQLCTGINIDTPCYGQTMVFTIVGGSPTNTYLWIYPDGVTNTSTSFSITPATWTDTGLYTIVKYDGGVVVDTYHVEGVIKPLPMVAASNNGPLCATAVDVLDLFATAISAGETFSWTGPTVTGFTSTLENPVMTTFTVVDTGWYKVVTTLNGCTDSAKTYVGVTPVPTFSVVNNSPICEWSALTITAIDTFTTSTMYSITGPGIVGTSSTPYTTLLSVGSAPESDSGVYTVNFMVGSCPALPVTTTVIIHSTPPLPTVVNAEYCQGMPADSLMAIAIPGDTLLWYGMNASGGTASYRAPVPSTANAGTFTYYVSQKLGACEGPRAALTVTIDPKPTAPTVTPVHYCYYIDAASPLKNVQPLVTTTAIAGDVQTWFGPGLPFTVGSGTITPFWNSTVPAGDTAQYMLYGVLQTSPQGCISDTTIDTVFLYANPQPPVVKDIKYCQYDFLKGNYITPAVTATITPGNITYWNTVANFATAVTTAPYDSTESVSTLSWDVWQLNPNTGCYNKTPSNVTMEILYKPEPMITAMKSTVCQYDTMSLSYSDVMGNNLVSPYFLWTIPGGDTFYTYAHNFMGDSTLTSVNVRFDSIYQDTIYLLVSDYSGTCYTDTSIIVKVIPAPATTGWVKPDACIGDTIMIALTSRSFNAVNFTWTVDNVNFFQVNNGVDSMVAMSSNAGGPFNFYFFNSGSHIFNITPYTVEGCPGITVHDTVMIHDLPVSTFTYGTYSSYLNDSGQICADDSVRFVCNDSNNYVNAYSWTPEHFFNNNNAGIVWGRVQQSGNNTIKLNVSDPWGCKSESTVVVPAEPCCDVWFPNCFVPDDLNHPKNTRFGPLFYYNSFHKFHIFQIVNRWGQTVFETTENDKTWDGTMNGVPQDIGVYYYYLKFDCNGNTVEKHGDVTLVR